MVNTASTAQEPALTAVVEVIAFPPKTMLWVGQAYNYTQTGSTKLVIVSLPTVPATLTLSQAP